MLDDEYIDLTQKQWERCRIFYEYLGSRIRQLEKREQFKYFFSATAFVWSMITFSVSTIHPEWTAEIAAAVIVIVILAGIKINRILSNIAQKKNTDHNLIEYMWNLLSDVVYLKTPVELPDFYKIRN